MDRSPSDPVRHALAGALSLCLVAAASGADGAASGGGGNPFTDEERGWWAFQPIGNPDPPAGAGEGWATNAIDRFVARRLDGAGLDPAPAAGPAELVRRLYFDLHGLPPDPAAVSDFAADPSPDAYRDLVDRLLASPRYGERWAQHWLDLVRYSESDGYNADAYRPHVWPYRDWVIGRLNDDAPYDQFVREQLAGDEIAPDDPDTLIATAFLRHPIYEWNQRDVRGQWDIILTDITDTAGELFLGLSFGCARCHDHKFDPILQRDYHALRAFFTPVLWRDDLPLATPQELAGFQAAQAAWEEATAGVRAEIDALKNRFLQPKVDVALSRFTDDLQALVNKPRGERTALEHQLARLCERQLEYEDTHFDFAKSAKSDEDKQRWRELQEELATFDHLKPEPPVPAFVATDAGPSSPETRMETRDGHVVVEPAFLSVLDTGPPEIEPTATTTGRRSALARWITDPSNPLAARVVVNRVWQYHFGRGLVATSSDFGKLGEPPSHPNLLDWLARRFVDDHGWRLKALHRDIVLSATYRQTAMVTPTEAQLRLDPNNRLLWRFNPRRLDAEQARDAMLAVSGELDLRAGGPSEDASKSTRRSVYTRKKRNSPDELLKCLDAPTGFASTSERQSTTTPNQALLLLNGDWSLERARAVAAKVDSVEAAWRRVLGRAPTPGEHSQAERFLQDRTAKNTGAGGAADVADQPAEGEFVPGSDRERVVVHDPENRLDEGDEFTVEAVVRLDSIDSAAAVRSIASRWGGENDKIEAFGWRLGVTGKKSKYQPRNLIVQLVGWDANSNIAYEVVPSDIRLELGRRYHVTARVSCSGGSVAFRVQDLGQPDAPVREATVPHAVRSGLGSGSSTPVIGGLHARSPAHQWDGAIEAVRIAGSTGPGPAGGRVPDYPSGILTWRAGESESEGGDGGTGVRLTWAGADDAGQPADHRLEAMADLCHVLLNSNEFFYLH